MTKNVRLNPQMMSGLAKKMDMQYKIIYEKSKDGYSAYVPYLPGCTSAGAERAEVEKNIVEAIKLHLEVLKNQKYT